MPVARVLNDYRQHGLEVILRHLGHFLARHKLNDAEREGVPRGYPKGAKQDKQLKQLV